MLIIFILHGICDVTPVRHNEFVSNACAQTRQLLPNTMLIRDTASLCSLVENDFRHNRMIFERTEKVY
jgi:hypothetical protein